jgi:excisionase family DNA binding protein
MKRSDYLVRRAVVIKRFAISDATLDRWIKAGRLTPVRLGSRVVRFLESELERLMAGGKKA